MKKRGFGAGRYNGFGGKVEPGETILQGAQRELQEVRFDDSEPAAICHIRAHKTDAYTMATTYTHVCQAAARTHTRTYNHICMHRHAHTCAQLTHVQTHM